MSDFSQIFINQRVLSALHIVKASDDTLPAMISRLLEERLAKDWPGIFDVVDELEANRDKTREQNRERVKEWLGILKKL